MKKAVCISCTHHYAERTRYIEAVLQSAGYACTYITSDFHHTSKKRHKVDLPHCIQIPTNRYTKNISPQRILSHIRFAKDAMKTVQQLRPDLLYVEVPPNSLCREAARYKRKNPQTAVIFDIFDLWPESFPNSRAKQLFKLPFGVWARFRNKGLPAADLVLTECDLFKEKLARYLAGTEQRTLYLCRPEATAQESLAPAGEKLQLCYLGAINNIIDIPTIAALVGQLNTLRPTALHIIGDGESREDFVSAVKATGAEVIFHGKIYDNAEKQAIFDRCSFGLNIMKDSVCIGLTMKSVDYFAGGLPIINTIGGDTANLVETAGIGVNVKREDLAETAREILACDSAAMGKNTLDVFCKLFAFDVFSENLTAALEQKGLAEK